MFTQVVLLFKIANLFRLLQMIQILFRGRKQVVFLLVSGHVVECVRIGLIGSVFFHLVKLELGMILIFGALSGLVDLKADLLE